VNGWGCTHTGGGDTLNAWNMSRRAVCAWRPAGRPQTFWSKSIKQVAKQQSSAHGCFESIRLPLTSALPTGPPSIIRCALRPLFAVHRRASNASPCRLVVHLHSREPDISSRGPCNLSSRAQVRHACNEEVLLSRQRRSSVNVLQTLRIALIRRVSLPTRRRRRRPARFSPRLGHRW
jgi:hypothetical protein